MLFFAKKIEKTAKFWRIFHCFYRAKNSNINKSDRCLIINTSSERLYQELAKFSLNLCIKMPTFYIKIATFWLFLCDFYLKLLLWTNASTTTAAVVVDFSCKNTQNTQNPAKSCKKTLFQQKVTKKPRIPALGRGRVYFKCHPLYQLRSLTYITGVHLLVKVYLWVPSHGFRKFRIFNKKSTFFHFFVKKSTFSKKHPQKG